jgi:ATP-dependent Clp protease ATP-binding subunit ClpA
VAPSSPAYTQRTRQALAFAEEEAKGLGHNYLGTEHLLLGLLRVADGVAASILAELGADESIVRETVIARVGLGAQQPSGELGYTPRARTALDQAVEQARHLGHTYIGTEHVLLGLLAEGEGVAGQILSRLGITTPDVLKNLQRIAAEGARGPRGPKGLESQFAERQRGVRRHTLVLPEELFQQVQALANEEQTSVTDLLRRFTKLGLVILEAQKAPNTSIVIRQGEVEQRLLVL